MPWMENKTVSGKKGSPRQDEYESGDMKIADLFRMLCEHIDRRFDEQEKKLDEIMKMTRGTSQRVSSLEQDARQRRLAMEADRPANTKTSERTSDAATAVQSMHGDSCSTDRIDPDPMCSTSFGDECTRPPAAPCSRESAMVDDRAAAPESCLPSLDMRSPTAAGGLVPTGEASRATKTTFNKSPLRPYATKEVNSKKLLADPSCRRVIETKSGQNRVFDPGRSQGRLRACPFLGTWRALLCGEFVRVGAAGDELQHFSEEIRWLFEARPALNMPCQNKSPAIEGGSRLQEGRTEVTPSMAARGYRVSGAIDCWGMLWSEERLVAA